MRADLQCSRCGAAGWAGCSCGTKYLEPITAATAAVLANPHKSDRALAAEIGVGSNTVRRARQKGTAPDGAVGKRVGRDGKARKQPKRLARKTPAPLIHEDGGSASY